MKIGKKLPIIVFVLAIVSLLVAVVIPLVYPKKSEPPTLKIQEYILSDILISTDLKEKEAQNAIDFIKLTIKEEYYPLDFSLLLIDPSESQSPEREYRGTWNRNGVFVSILYIKGPEESIPEYIRVWSSKPGELNNKSVATKLSKDFFSDSFLTKVALEKITCDEIKDDGIDGTQCGSMMTQEDESLMGVTVSGPVAIDQDNFESLIFTACKIPKEGTPFYTSKYCI